jgi:uncharacterized protein YigE (DUF2233 family)
MSIVVESDFERGNIDVVNICTYGNIQVNIEKDNAINYVADTFNCHTLTIKMPFKDNKNSPYDNYGWSISRCRKFGEDMLLTINSMLAKF